MNHDRDRRDSSQSNQHSTSDEDKTLKENIAPLWRKEFLLSLAIVVVSSSTGNLALKYGLSGDRAPSVSTIAEIPQAALSTLTNGWVVLGIVLEIIEFISFVYALRSGPFSLVIPIRGAANYILLALLASVFLNQTITPMTWVALLIILTGVSLIAYSGEKT